MVVKGNLFFCITKYNAKMRVTTTSRARALPLMHVFIQLIHESPQWPVHPPHPPALGLCQVQCEPRVHWLVTS